MRFVPSPAMSSWSFPRSDDQSRVLTTILPLLSALAGDSAALLLTEKATDGVCQRVSSACRNIPIGHQYAETLEGQRATTKTKAHRRTERMAVQPAQTQLQAAHSS